MNAQLQKIVDTRTIHALVSADSSDKTLVAWLLSIPLPDNDAERLVHWLKQEADAAWYRDAHRTLDYGDMIVRIGKARNDAKQIALGTMTQGDALRMLNRAADAWNKLEQAGDLFLNAQDDFGWARTRIGRLGLSTELGFVETALEEAARAREIFGVHGDRDMLLRLDLNTAVVYDLIGDHAEALARYQQALDAAIALGSKGDRYLPILYTNMGYAYNFLGDFRSATTYYDKAKARMLARGETSGIVNIDLALAYIALGQGQYKRALALLHDVIDRAAEQFPKETALARREIVECYLPLNQFLKARDLAVSVIRDYERAGSAHDRARTLLLLAEAEVNLDRLDAASEALDQAEQIFASLGAHPWQATARLRRGQIALQQGDRDRALQDGQEATQIFAAGQRPVYQAEALLLQGQAELALGDTDAALRSVKQMLELVQNRHVPPLIYSANLLLGQATLALGDRETARRYFKTAVGEVEQAQQQLTITFRSSFVENRADALHALIGLSLDADHAADAFTTLERAKALNLLTYLNGRDQLRWGSRDARTRALVDELATLRGEHHWYYRLANQQIDDERAKITPDDAYERLKACEQRIRAITEKLYLSSANRTDPRTVTVPTLTETQAALPAGAALVEYYANANDLWVFVVTPNDVVVQRLALSAAEINEQVERLQLNVNRALRLGRNSNSTQTFLAEYFDGIAATLYDALIAPIESAIDGCQRLYVVPYGALHYLPFHLLRNDGQYLIETHEIVTLPSAALLTRPQVKRSNKGLILTHSWDGKLPQTYAEADVVSQYFPSTVYHDDDATRKAFAREPGKLLHIAAHGSFRMDEPDFSFVQLAKQPLFIDDLLQYDMSYELVTLSACETGRARVAPGDELIGLGQGFLYGGAGALIASLWRIEDGTTLPLMDHLYRALEAGHSKVGALRDAQLATREGRHPAFWGAFVLIGNPDALTATHEGSN